MMEGLFADLNSQFAAYVVKKIKEAPEKNHLTFLHTAQKEYDDHALAIRREIAAGKPAAAPADAAATPERRDDNAPESPQVAAVGGVENEPSAVTPSFHNPAPVPLLSPVVFSPDGGGGSSTNEADKFEFMRTRPAAQVQNFFGAQNMLRFLTTTTPSDYHNPCGTPCAAREATGSAMSCLARWPQQRKTTQPLLLLIKWWVVPGKAAAEGPAPPGSNPFAQPLPDFAEEARRHEILIWPP